MKTTLFACAFIVGAVVYYYNFSVVPLEQCKSKFPYCVEVSERTAWAGK